MTAAWKILVTVFCMLLIHAVVDACGYALRNEIGWWIALLICALQNKSSTDKGITE